MDNIVYRYEGSGSKYINLTNQCQNSCDFCIRNNAVGVSGYHLWIEREPTAKEVINELARQGEPYDVVFCGYGEPTMALDVLKEVAAWVKEQGGTTRLNTNGLANRYFGRNVAEELAGLVDVASVSLNEADAKKYDAVCHSVYGEEAFYDMLDFARKAGEAGIDTVLSVVDIIGEQDIEKCRRLAEEAGVRLRVREYSDK